jgi:SAM-dependent methyltransferase
MAEELPSIDPLHRFSNRAQAYHNRPRYAEKLLPFLQATYVLSGRSVVADVGSGTGFLTRLLLRSGCRVYAIEPNAGMRAVAESELSGQQGFVSLDGQAEHLPLPDASVDAVTVGQALHWFNVEEARAEFLRVLRPNGWCIVADNRAIENANELTRSAEEICKRYFQDIGKAAEPPAKVLALFRDYGFNTLRLDNPFTCGEETYVNGFLNSSLAPEPGSPNWERAAAEVRALFARHAVNGQITLPFETVVYHGRLKPVRTRPVRRMR